MAFSDLSSAAILAATIGIPWMLSIGFLHLGSSDDLSSPPLDFPTMKQVLAPVLPGRPAFLPATELRYDDLLKSPEKFAGRLYGCAF